MAGTLEDREREWTCGRCKKKNVYTDQASERCRYCGYIHGTRDDEDIPEMIPIKLRG